MNKPSQYSKDDIKSAILLAFHLGVEEKENYNEAKDGSKLDWENATSQKVLDLVFQFIESRKR